MSIPLCIYHANCTDGFTAAWAVWRALDLVEFTPASYGDAPPDVAGRDVIIVDFSYKRPVLERMAQTARSILILDHHKTAQADLAGLPAPAGKWDSHKAAAGNPVALFDMDRSGAQMAWDYFHDTPRPLLVDYVADRDLWQWKMDKSRQVSAFIASLDPNFIMWNQLAKDVEDLEFGFRAIVEQGQAILRQRERDIDRLIGATQRTMRIGGHEIPVANCPPFLASEVAGRMAEQAPFAATYYDGPKGRAFSLRSRGDDGADVAEIAALYGGGGHRNAAGFLAPHGWEGTDAASDEGAQTLSGASQAKPLPGERASPDGEAL